MLVMDGGIGIGIGASWRPHGKVVYRVDPTGARVGVLPATCRRGPHSLHKVGYRATEAAGVLHVSCSACGDTTPPHPQHYWALETSGPPPDRAELDDRPYAEPLAEIRTVPRA